MSESGLQRGHFDLRSPFQCFYRVLQGTPLPLILKLDYSPLDRFFLLTFVQVFFSHDQTHELFHYLFLRQDSYFHSPDYFVFPTNNFKEVHVIKSFNFMYHDQEVFGLFNFMKG